MRFSVGFAFAFALGMPLFCPLSYGADLAVAELVREYQSPDAATRQNVEAKLRALLGNTLGVPQNQVDSALAKLISRLQGYEKMRLANAQQYVDYTVKMRRDSTRTEGYKDQLAHRYERQRDDGNLRFLFREFKTSPKGMGPAELGAQVAFIKLLMPEFVSFAPNNYMMESLDLTFDVEPAYQVKSETRGSRSHLFHEEMKEIFQRAVYLTGEDPEVAEFKERFRKLCSNDPYKILPTSSKEARTEALAAILLNASEKIDIYQFDLEEALRQAEGKVSFTDQSKKRVEYQIDRYDIAAQMVKRMELKTSQPKLATDTVRRLLRFLGVHRETHSPFFEAILDHDATYRSSSPALNERNALVGAKSAWVLSLLVEHIRKNGELGTSALFKGNDRWTIGQAADELWAEREKRLTSPTTLADVHCRDKIRALAPDNFHSQTIAN